MDIYEKVKARFTKESKKKDMLACCYCLSKFKVVDVNDFTTADSEGKKKIKTMYLYALTVLSIKLFILIS